LSTVLPELVIVNAEIRTGRPGITSLAVTDGRISALDSRPLDDLAGRRTQIIDARGGAWRAGM